MIDSTIIEPASRNHLVIDRYIADFIPAQALWHALSNGLVDQLANQSTSTEQLAAQIVAEPESTELQLSLLASTGVVDGEENNIWHLTEHFTQALTFRDLLEAKLAFATLLAPDLLTGGKDFFSSLHQFMSSARTFDLFDYQRCFEVNEENLTATDRWVTLTAAYTRYEAVTLTDYLDLSDHRQLLDIGGNNGELALHLCHHLPELRATVADLPVVCELGRRRVAATSKAAAIHFVDTDLRHEQPPGHYDLVILKSLLHDWPDEAIEHFIDRAWQALEPGGQLIIFERIKANHSISPPRYGDLPIFVFAQFYRDPNLYINRLQQFGFVNIEQRKVNLDWPFTLITARKPALL